MASLAARVAFEGVMQILGFPLKGLPDFSLRP